MRNIPVDANRVRFIATGKHAARAKFAELTDGSRKRVPDSHDTDEQGRPLWVVDVMIDDPGADRAEIAGVKIASHEVPETRLGEEVRFVNLTCSAYVQNGSKWPTFTFKAEGIERATAPGKPAAA
ncbi:MAG: hypothetical protein NTW05_09345 [Pseudonocardiales bacterium]|nr:hypothetical protein [Pseudonocardiales bacterium]